MEHWGVRYTIRVGIEPDLWSVTIHPGAVESAAKKVRGTRETAESHARSMINRWLQKQSATHRTQSTLNLSNLRVGRTPCASFTDRLSALAPPGGGVTCCDGGPALPRSAYCTTHRLQRVVYRFTSGMSAGGLGISSPNTLGVGSGEFAWLACVAPRPR
jgi:hypothetical protein